MRVIENEFNDKNYKREFPFSIYSLDFAWVEKKKCIEIDGEQHHRFEEYRERDKRKDNTLRDSGWDILRIEWKKMFKDTKKWIKIANDFVGV
jgi:very-short-patch-repair endonuclease